MGSGRPRRRTIVALVALATCVHAQRPAATTLDDILQKLQQNLDAYDGSIPSFFCQEHLNSIVEQVGARGSSAPNYQTLADSIFRLKREGPPGQTQELAESREIRSVNGHAPRSDDDLNAPSMIGGVFSGGLSVVSLEQKACMRYTLERVRAGKPYVVRFTTVPAEERTDQCILQEDGSGRAEIDPVSMQIERLEIKVPHHAMQARTFNGGRGKATLASWLVSVDYAPVVLDARTFWLPKTIHSRMRAQGTQWSFEAAYGHYHKLEVTTRILPAGDATPP